MTKTTKARAAALAGLTVLVVAGTAFAQQPNQAPRQSSVRVRGTIEDVAGNVLKVKSREGSELSIKLTDDVRVTAIVKASLSDVAQNSFVGVTAVPEPDGGWKALEVHILPEASRGAGEGDRPSDLLPRSTMTNATVTAIKTADTVTNVSGTTLTLKYKEGEKVVLVPPDAPIVTYAGADKSELKPGAKIIIIGATRNADGTLQTNRVNVGRDGLTPPM